MHSNHRLSAWSGNESTDSIRANKSARVDYSQSLSSSTHEEESNKPAALHSALDTLSKSLMDVKRLVSSAESGPKESLAEMGSTVHWDDVAKLLPAPNECQELIHCFFTELEWYQCGVNQTNFYALWEGPVKRKEAMPRHSVALICGVFAFTLLLAPRSHPASRLPQSDNTNPRRQIENARLLIDAFYHFPTHKEEEEEEEFMSFANDKEMLGQLQAETLFCYYCVVAGLTKKAWFGLGKAIRLAKGMDLFDESRWSLSRAEREERRGIAWDLITMDRWCSMHIGRSGELMSPVNVLYPSTKLPHATMRNQCMELIRRTFEFLKQCSSMEVNDRFAAAREMDAQVEAFQTQLPPELQFKNASLSDLEPETMKRAAPSLTFYFSSKYLRIMIMRPFLMDPSAPLDLRFGSLQHARSIIESTPHMVALSSSPYVSFPAAWNSQFLFVAAATFASVVLSKNEVNSISKEDSAMKAKVGWSDHIASTNKNLTIWPEEDLDWFASTLFDVVQTFDVVSQGARGYTARTCKNLLLGLCTSRETLRKRFQDREKARIQKVGGKKDSKSEAFKRTSLPSVFSPDNDSTDSSTSRKHGLANDGSHHRSFGGSSDSLTSSAAHSPATSHSAQSYNGHGGYPPHHTLQVNTTTQPDSTTTVSAGEVLADLGATPIGNGMQGSLFGMDQFNFEVPFLDSQEWANLTSNLNMNITPRNL
ncbi:uncharacterized protein FA14DRAFT_159610 [Meira miltonrushii]|uniref:Xylanolytic transcriptional activator regulatory domain-containing protein n=1 Tax=Meira miltonrushii TaxID=1280837 RepID=A0A316VQ97_9BASI|nr:uncharacterized protein FA14DRAFT_159610 [Meira miltonrushii]PWN37665.1 hypothetical protein FA14DRAFT_159610 [Meira miltonrushii]